MNNTFEWDDLRLILAVGRSGTLSGAARALRVSHPTVFRRLAEIEQRMGVALFERSRSGYTATTAGEEAIATAGRIETEVNTLEQQVIGRDLRPSGTVSVTTTDALHFFFFSPIFSRFCVDYPEIDLDVIVSNSLFDLSQRESDIAIRPTTSPPEHLIGRRLGAIRQSIYGARALVNTLKKPWRDKAVKWIGPDRYMAYPALQSWMSRQELDQQCQLRVNSSLAMYAAARESIGLAVLPDYLATQDPALVRLEPIPTLDVDLWLLTHPSLRRTARIRAFMDFVADAAKDLP